MGSTTMKATDSGSNSGVVTQHYENFAPPDLDSRHAAVMENPDKPKLGWKTFVTILALILPLASSIIVLVCLGTILIQVGQELGDTENAPWMLSAWSVASSVSFAIAGNLSDVFGRRFAVLGGQALTIIALIVGCTAQTTLHVVVGNAILGFASGIVFVSYAGITELLPNKWRGAGIGATELAFLLPWGPFGTLISVNILRHTHLSWRWIYIIALMYAVLGMATTALLYFPPPRPRYDFDKTRWQEFREIDFIGCTLYAAGLTITLIGFSWAGTRYSWKSSAVLAPLVIGVCLLVIFVVYEFTLAKNPFLPPSIMTMYREYTLLVLVSFMCGALYYSMSSILPQAALYIFTNDPIQVGLIQIPQGAGQILVGVLSSFLMGKLKFLRFQLVVWVGTMLIFTAVLAATVPYNKAAFSALQFFGMGAFPIVASLCYVVASLNVPLKNLGLAIGLIGTFRSAGGSLGNSVLYTVFNTYAENHLSDAIVSVSVPLGFSLENIGPLINATVLNAIGVPYAFASVEGANPAVQQAAANALKVVYAGAFRRVCYVSAVFGGIAVLAAVLVKDSSCYLTDHVAVTLQTSGMSPGGESARATIPMSEQKSIVEGGSVKQM